MPCVYKGQRPAIGRDIAAGRTVAHADEETVKLGYGQHAVCRCRWAVRAHVAKQ
jgi:hypothetical protein